MSDLLFTVNAVLPIILMVSAGYFLKRAKIITSDGAREMNKLVFKLFLPVLLFINVYKINIASDIKFSYILFACAVVLFVFFIALFLVRFVTDDNKKKGALVQGIFRSNYALIGIPLATSIDGNEGGMYATVLSAFSIPLFNILAVAVLTSYSEDEKKKIDFKKILLGIIKNPLIDAIALGGVCLLIRYFFVRCEVNFRLSDVEWLYKVLSQFAAVASPLALVALGANFEFSAIPEMKKEIIFGTVARCVAVPIVGLSPAILFGSFSSGEFAALLALFGTSIAVSSVPMAQAMNSDAKLAGQLVVWTTVASAFTLFVFIYILRVIGIF